MKGEEKLLYSFHCIVDFSIQYTADQYLSY